MNTIFKSKYFSFLIIAGLLLFLFQGIFQTYAFTDGYEFIWNSSEADSFTTFIQQGRAFSGWIITSVYPSAIQHISDYSNLRVINLLCLLLSALIIYKILIRNKFNNYQGNSRIVFGAEDNLPGITIDGYARFIWLHRFLEFYNKKTHEARCV